MRVRILDNDMDGLDLLIAISEGLVLAAAIYGALLAVILIGVLTGVK